eukprot:TRINITY_DN2923_c0_g2_i7.p1 TRINITY_DN2923_c0_g2~~TRINITY_DN2923_c0_g2_i7.p1  ORF type:complete len:361 (-),score=55.83 TRINITY_DN2923_c0_g2_i7:114-1196(-)
MGVLDVGTGMSEQVFQRMELGKSYSIAARKIDGTQEGYQITSGETLIFIDNVESVAKYSEMAVNVFYKKLFEMVKNSKSPIIIGCEEKIPFVLQKKSSLFEFMYLKRPLEEEEILLLHGNMIYFLEKSNCMPELMKKTENDATLEEIADTLKQYTDTLNLDALANPSVLHICKEAQGNVDLFLSRLYELIQTDISLDAAVPSISCAIINEEMLDYMSLADTVEECKECEIAKSEELSINFFNSISVHLLSDCEYPMTIECLRVRVEKQVGYNKASNRKTHATQKNFQSRHTPHVQLFGNDRAKDLGTSQMIEVPINRLNEYFDNMQLGNWTQLQEFKQFINDNGALHSAYRVPQSKILIG